MEILTLDQIIKKHLIKLDIGSFSEKGLKCVKACTEEYAAQLQERLRQSESDIADLEITRNVLKLKLQQCEKEMKQSLLLYENQNATIIRLSSAIDDIQNRIGIWDQIIEEQLNFLLDGIQTLEKNNHSSEKEKYAHDKVAYYHDKFHDILQDKTIIINSLDEEINRQPESHSHGVTQFSPGLDTDYDITKEE